MLLVGSSISQNIPLAHARLGSSDIMSSYELIENMNKTDETIRNDLDENTNSAQEMILKSKSKIETLNKNTDWNYMQHLDLAIGEVALFTGVVQNLRFNNGYTNEITVKNSHGISWSKDKGKGLASIMTFMFPSSSGSLSTEMSSNNCFSGAVEPTPEIMARLIDVIYTYRNSKDKVFAIEKQMSLNFL